MTALRRWRFPLGVIGLGAFCNLLVVIANSGVMPVSGAEERTLTDWNLYATYEHANTEHHLVWLGDHMALGGASPGDLIVLAGVLLIALVLVGRWVAGR